MHKKSFRWTAPLLVGVMLSGPAFAGASIATTPTPASAPQQEAPAAATSPAQTAGGSAAPELRYQEREAAAAGLEGWKGGDGISVYLGGSALALVVLILVLLVLL